MSNYPDNFKGTNMDVREGGHPLAQEFEPVAFSECDDCQELNQLNEFGLCKSCNAAAEVFASAAANAMRRGHDPYRAGMIAQAEVMRNQATKG